LRPEEFTSLPMAIDPDKISEQPNKALDTERRTTRFPMVS